MQMKQICEEISVLSTLSHHSQYGINLCSSIDKCTKKMGHMLLVLRHLYCLPLEL